MGFVKCGTASIDIYLNYHQLIKELDWWKNRWEDIFGKGHRISRPLDVFSYMNMFKSASQDILQRKLEELREIRHEHKRQVDKKSRK